MSVKAANQSELQIQLQEMKNKRSELEKDVGKILDEMVARRAGKSAGADTDPKFRAPVLFLQKWLDSNENQVKQLTERIIELTKKSIGMEQQPAHVQDQDKYRKRQVNQWLKEYYDQNKDDSLMCQYYSQSQFKSLNKQSKM